MYSLNSTISLRIIPVAKNLNNVILSAISNFILITIISQSNMSGVDCINSKVAKNKAKISLFN